VRPPPIVVLALVVGGCTATAAVAAPPWSAPRDVSGTYTRVTAPFAGFGSGGTALLSWSEHVARPGGALPLARTRLATLLRDGSVADRGTLPGGLATPPQVYGRDRTVILRAKLRGTRDVDLRTRIRLDATYGTTSRPLGGRSRRVAEFQALTGDQQGPALAVGRAGEIAVAWVDFQQRGPAQDDLRSRYRVRLAIGHAGRRFSRPRTVATFPLPTRDSQAVTLAYGPRGELLVAYGIGRRTGRSLRVAVAARVRRPGGRFDRAQVLGPRQALTDLAAAVAPDGRMAVVWGSQDSGEEAGRPWIVRAALRSPPRRFAAASVLDPGETPERVPGHLAVVTAPDGSATAVWGNVRRRGSDAQFPIRTATAPPRGGFGPVTELAGMGVIGSVAAAANGATLVTWTNQALGYVPPSPEQGDVLAALRPAGVPAFGAPETVSSAALEDGFPAAAAFDPRTHRPTVIWPAGARNEGSLSGPLDAARIQLATRAG
jgi:hypothetical protein